ncbi:MAG: cobalamin biosynthesis protein CbiD [Clostridia bacterium]|nr:cobalamin biosynthesis protein CbiD [Clostridia bacterium]
MVNIMEFQPYAIVNGKKMRRGFTTGSCAAAASKAATMMLIENRDIHSIEIDTPRGWRITLPIQQIERSSNAVKCCVVKDGGDDPDATHGIHIYASARLIDKEGIVIRAGEGIGTVTRPGLQVEVGQPAVNPVPRQMILKEVGEVLPKGKGVEITLSIPEGVEVAKKTFNPRLGISGGISILGTSGIVEPMSEEAWRESLALELSMLAAAGHKNVVLVPGNYGEQLAIKSLHIHKDIIVRTSNFIGYMLEKCVEYGFEKVLLIGHLGKLVKVAAGIFYTHSHMADARAEIMTAYAAAQGADWDTVKELLNSNTTEEAVQLLEQAGITGIYGMIARRVGERCRQKSGCKLQVGTVIFTLEKGILAMDDTAKSILQELKQCE